MKPLRFITQLILIAILWACSSAPEQPASPHSEDQQNVELPTWGTVPAVENENSIELARKQRALEQQQLAKKRLQEQQAKQSRQKASYSKQQARLEAQRAREREIELKKQQKSHSKPRPNPQQTRESNKDTGLLELSEELDDLLDLPKEKQTVTVKRHPTIESPEELIVGESMTVMISLTEDLITPSVQVTQGKTDSSGRLEMSLPQIEPDQSWPIDVVLSASGFSFDSPNKATIHLPKNGDSSPAMFQLTAKENPAISSKRQLYATFWFKGQYIARVTKPITINEKKVNEKVAFSTKAVSSKEQACTSSLSLSKNAKEIAQQTELMQLDEHRKPADLTIYMRRDWDSCSSTDYFITLSSPHSETTHERISLPQDIGSWLLPKYKQFSKTGRGIKIVEKSNIEPDKNKDWMAGFGRTLYQQFAPNSFKTKYQKLIEKLGDEFKSIQIYTDEPTIPWELMIPKDTTQFLGIKHTVGRWIIPKNSSRFTTPSQNLDIESIDVIAPKYKGDLALAEAAGESEFISGLNFNVPIKSINGDYSSFKSSLIDKNNGIIHYAGHGYTTRENNSTISDYGLVLEDTNLHALNWRGILGDKTNSSFVFFNACDVGQAEKVAGFVGGWSSALIDTGSVGFISGLWELGDSGAAQFSKGFYQELRNQFNESGQASIADAMQIARKAFEKTGNPTYLAYVFYGDPALTLNIKHK